MGSNYAENSVEENERVALRLRAGDKAKIMRASALKNMDLTRFVVHTALAAAEEVIEQAERLKLTGRDSVRILELLDNPPPNARLLASPRELPA
jgi:uncharacterized protein (DUF1778 family)